MVHTLSYILAYNIKMKGYNLWQEPSFYPKSDDGSTVSDHVQIKNVFHGFMASATTHGFSAVYKSKGSFKRKVWICMTVCATGALVLQLYFITKLYAGNPVRPRVVKQTARSLEFPAVTVCNTNPIKSSALSLDPRLQALVSGWGTEAGRRKKRSVDDFLNANQKTGTESETNQETGERGVGIHEAGSKSIQERGTGSDNIHLHDTGIKSIFSEITQDNKIKEMNPIFTAKKNNMKNSTGSDTIHECGNSHHIQSISTSVYIPVNTSLFTLLKYLPFYKSFLNLISGWVGEITNETNETFKREKRSINELINSLQNTNDNIQEYYQCSNISGYGRYCFIKWNVTAVEAEEACVVLSKYTNEGNFQLVSIETQAKKRAIRTDSILNSGVPDNTYFHIGLTWNGEELKWQSGQPWLMFAWSLPNGYTMGTYNYTRVKALYNATLDRYSHKWKGALATDSNWVLCEDGIVDITTTAESTTTETTVSSPRPTSIYFAEKDPPREDFVQEAELLETISNIPEETKKTMGYNLNEFVLSCKYRNKDCDTPFGQFFDAVHGNCYVFNSGWVNDTETILASRPGHQYGLTMTFNLGQQEYITGVSESAGVVVVVHPRDRMPFPEDEGVFATPGRLTSISVNQVFVSRLGGKYSDCSDDMYNPLRNVFEEYHNVKYSMKACYTTCYQKYVIQRCGCSDPQYPNQGVAFGNFTVELCNARNITQDDCVYGVQKAYIANALECDCPIPCNETLYKYLITTSEWPSEKHMKSFIAKNSVKMESTLNYSSATAYIRRNLVSIEVYFTEFNYHYMFDKPKYPLVRYLADVASVLGLWLGMSIFSVLEFLEFAVDLIVTKCLKIKKPNQGKDPSPHNQAVDPLDTINTQDLVLSQENHNNSHSRKDQNTCRSRSSSSSFKISQFTKRRISTPLSRLSFSSLRGKISQTPSSNESGMDDWSNVSRDLELYRVYGGQLQDTPLPRNNFIMELL